MKLTPRFFTTCVAFAALTGLLVRGAEPAPAAPGLAVKLAGGGEKNFGASPVLIVPTLNLYLPVAGKVFVAKQGSALSGIGRRGGANTVRASANFAVTGLDKALAQQLAKEVYDDLVSKLRAAGYTVKTYEDIANLDVVKRAEREKPDAAWGIPIVKDGSNMSLVATPSDGAAFKTGLAGGVFDAFMHFGKSTLGEGTVIIPSYYIACPQAWGEKNESYSSISAEVNVAPGMNLMRVAMPLLTEKGSWGDTHLKNPLINVTKSAGTLTKQDTTSHAANAFSKSLSLLSGAGSITGSSANYEFALDREAYRAGILAGTGAFNTEAAKLIGAQRKK